MKTIEKNIKLKSFSDKALQMYFENKKYAVFDIETTGLSASNCCVILTGILIPDGDSCRVIQYFAETPEDEEEVISRTLQILKSVDYVITYNGRHFDMPFMKKRAAKYSIDMDDIYNLDLYLVINGHAPFRKLLPNLKQKSIEKFMGLAKGRDDEISGGESVELYNQYLRTHSRELEERILLHNHDDIIQLYRILPIIEKTDFHRAMYKLGYPCGNLITVKTWISGHDLKITGRQVSDPVSYIAFPDTDKPYSITMNAADRSFEITVMGDAACGAIFIDAAAVLGDRIRKIDEYYGVSDGFLIASEEGRINYLETNAFVREMIEMLSENK